jgi:hypothetical protein
MHILRKIGIRGTLADRSITESPFFGSIQWRQSLSHMPRATPQPAPQLQPEPEPEPALEPEPMDIPELAAEHEMAFEPQREAEEQPEEYEDEECITLRRSDLLHFQDTLVDI